MAIKAVLFDMDGLLIDSEVLYRGATVEAAMDQGIDQGCELHQMTLGMTQEMSNSLYKSEFPHLNLERFWITAEHWMRKWIKDHGVPCKPFSLELLRWAKDKGLLLAVCSGNNREVVLSFLTLSGMIDYFSVIVAGDDDKSLGSKPEPGIYKRAAELLSVSADDCLVLEDAPNGLKAGRAAGMMTVMIPDLIPYADSLAPFCDAVFPNLSFVPDFIDKQLCQSVS